VLADLAPIERRVKTREGEALRMRIRPYRTAEDKIDGVVVTFMR
jgi:two-component system, chemotaxis family, CheB/CheR fusion protein